MLRFLRISSGKPGSGWLDAAADLVQMGRVSWVLLIVCYERAGGREYWLIDPVARIATVFMLGNDGRYGRPEVYADEETMSVPMFPDLSINLSLVFLY